MPNKDYDFTRNTKGYCPREKKMQFFFFDFLLLDSNHAQQRKEESYRFEGRSELLCSIFCCKNKRTLRKNERTKRVLREFQEFLKRVVKEVVLYLY
jgi:hypothetical protein